MKVYESVCIISPSQADEDVAKLISKLEETIVKAGASVLKVTNEGKKKLAYDVQHERRGTYVIVHFQGKGNVVSEVERFHRMEDSIMKFLTVEIPEDLLKAAEEEAKDTEAQKEEVAVGSQDDGI